MDNKKLSDQEEFDLDPSELSMEDILLLAREAQQAGRYTEAERVYRSALEHDPENVMALNFLAILCYQKGDLEEATRLVQRAIEFRPGDASLHNNLGNLYRILKKTDAAMASYEHAIALNPDHGEAHNNLSSLYRHLGENDKAVASYRKAIEVNPKLTEAYINLGEVLSGQGKEQEAIDALKTAVQIDSTNLQAYISMGSALIHAGRRDQAADVYRQVLAIDPAHAVAQHMLAACTGEQVEDRAQDHYVKAVFDHFADNFDSQLERLKYRAPQLVGDALSERLGAAHKQYTILDAGCGTGLCGPYLSPFASHLVGVDLSPRMLKRAQERGYQELAESELVEYLLAHEDRYDVAVSSDTLNYFGVLEPAMRAFYRALKEQGLLIFTLEKRVPVPLEASASGETDAGFQISSSGRYCHTVDYVTHCLNQAGMTLDSIDDVHLRLESAKPVSGLLVVARKPSA